MRYERREWVSLWQEVTISHKEDGLWLFNMFKKRVGTNSHPFKVIKRTRKPVHLLVPGG